MDSNTFVILVLTLGTIIIVAVIWQVFSVARARARAAASTDQAERLRALDERHEQLEQRLSALAGDVQELDERVAAIDTQGPT